MTKGKGYGAYKFIINYIGKDMKANVFRWCYCNIEQGYP